VTATYMLNRSTQGVVMHIPLESPWTDWKLAFTIGHCQKPGMTDLLPPELIVTELPDGVRYSLPRRKSGPFTCHSAVHLLGSLRMGIPFMAFWLWAVGCHIDWQDILRPENGLSLMFMAFGLSMLLMAVWLGGRGLFLWAGHSEIELRGGRQVDGAPIRPLRRPPRPVAAPENSGRARRRRLGRSSNQSVHPPICPR